MCGEGVCSNDAEAFYLEIGGKNDRIIWQGAGIKVQDGAPLVVIDCITHRKTFLGGVDLAAKVGSFA